MLGCFTASEIIHWAKLDLEITHSDECMTDDEIARAMRWILSHSGGFHSDGRYTRQGLEMLLTLTILAFPDFYQRYALSQFN